MSCLTSMNSAPVSSITTTSISHNTASQLIKDQSNIGIPFPNTEHLTSTAVILNRTRLQDLVREVDPNVQLDDDVEELLMQLADDFIDEVVDTSAMLAKHRNASALEVKDVQLSLEQNWNMWIPGFGCEELRPYKRSALTEAHKQRMTLIRKQKK